MSDFSFAATSNTLPTASGAIHYPVDDPWFRAGSEWLGKF